MSTVAQEQAGKGGSNGDEHLKRFIVSSAKAEGFDVVRVVAPDAIPEASSRLAEFIAEGRHGTMQWIADTQDRRADPAVLWPEVRSVVMLAMNYGPDHDPLDILARKDRAAISVYAQNRDYHDVIKGRLKTIAQKLAARAGSAVKVFVDTAPVMEKPLAEKAGIGWQGKHTNLVSRSFGSWVFLGSIFTTADLPRDEPEPDHCGSCRACLDICPTEAFPKPYQLDARRCISYLTIEHHGPIPREFRRPIGNRIYGCDDCLAVCPWNKFAEQASEAKLSARRDLTAPALVDLLSLDDRAFRTFFSRSPIKRIGRERFIRNVLIAAGNSGCDDLIRPVMRLVGDLAPIVRASAIWALRELAGAERFATLAAELPPSWRVEDESHPDVIEEWRWAFGEFAEGRTWTTDC